MSKQQTVSQSRQKHKQKKKKYVNILSGFFPVFFYFPVELNSQTNRVRQQIMDWLRKSNIQFQQLRQTHITITKTINILQTEVKEIQQKISKSMKGRVHLPIVLLFKRVKVLQNFICLQVQKITSQRLKKVTEIIGETIPKPYFEQPIYHVSLFRLATQLKAQQIIDIETAIQLKNKMAMLLPDLYLNSGIKKIKLFIK